MNKALESYLDKLHGDAVVLSELCSFAADVERDASEIKKEALMAAIFNMAFNIAQRLDCVNLPGARE